LLNITQKVNDDNNLKTKKVHAYFINKTILVGLRSIRRSTIPDMLVLLHIIIDHVLDLTQMEKADMVN
jgi:hypothetical protein